MAPCLRVALVAACVLGSPCGAWAADSDGDGVPNLEDDCRQHANPAQTDSDGDGAGNRCDPDFDGDGVVGGPDFAVLRANLGLAVPPAPAVADLDGDSAVGPGDVAIFAAFFAQAPGPGAVPVPLAPGVGAALAVGLLWAARRLRRARGSARCGLAPALLLAIVAPAGETRAQTSIDWVWTSTTGAGTPGSDAIAASAGDVLTAEIVVTPDGGGVSFAAVSLRFDEDLADELDLVSVQEGTLPGGVNLTAGPEASEESTASQGGSVLTLETATTAAGTFDPFVLATLEFAVNAAVASDGVDVSLGFFFQGVDGVNDDANAVVTSGVALGTGSVDACSQIVCADADVDGFGDPETCACGPLAGYVPDASDCNDGDGNAFPGQTTWFTTPNTGGDFDYDCDEAETQEDTQLGSCIPNGFQCTTTLGWFGPAPACGVSSVKVSFCTPSGCLPIFDPPETQACR